MSADPNGVQPARAARRHTRVLVVCPSWVGDLVMATPALRLIRDALPGAFLGGLVRPGLDELLAGTTFFDGLHVDRARGMMGPKHVAAKIRPRAYDAALLLTNSFSTALITRLAFIPRRVGYDRDARGLLLTDRLRPDRRGVLGYACVPAVEYYLRITRMLLGWPPDVPGSAPRLELGVAAHQEQAARDLLARAGVPSSEPVVILNPGANDAAKRWPPDRFAQVAVHLARAHRLRTLVSGAPSELELVDGIVESAGATIEPDLAPISLPRLGVTLGSLKHLVRRARLMLTNDTGPRHIAAAFGVPTLTLFGPTDPRWTTLPKGRGSSPRIDLVADPTLPPDQVADDHPERCKIDRIEVGAVTSACDQLLALNGASTT